MPLVAYYPLDGDATDASGNGNDGTVNGATVDANGILGTQCYSFDYTAANYIDIPDLPTFSQYTLAGWIMFNTFSTGDFQKVISIGQNNDINPGVWNSSHANAGQFRYWQRDAASTDHKVFSSTLSTGTWYHWAQTWDGSTMRGYLDGIEVGSTAVPSMDTSRNDSDAIGYSPTEASYPLDGLADDVRIYDHALTPAEVAYLYSVTQRAVYTTKVKTL